MTESSIFYGTLFGWILLWCVVLHLQKGARHIESTYRLNLWHGVASSYLVLHSFWYQSTDNTYPEMFVLSCSLSYFIVDLNNMIMNDFVYKAEGAGTHKGIARAIEYFHHVLGIAGTLALATVYPEACDLSNPVMQWKGPQNPLLRFALADLSTPPLIMWRRSQQTSLLWYSLFVVLFLGVRIFYHGLYFVPSMFAGCNIPIKIAVVMYQVLQLAMTVFVLQRWWKMVFARGSPDKASLSSSVEAVDEVSAATTADGKKDK